MKKIKNILFVALGLFMITFALVGCSNNEASEDVSRRTSLVGNSNQVSVANLSTTTSTAISLGEAVENAIKFNRLFFSTQNFETEDAVFNLANEYSMIAGSSDCPFFTDQNSAFFDRPVDSVYIPVYSSELGKFIYGVSVTYDMDGCEAYETSTIPTISSVGIDYISEDIASYVEMVDYVETYVSGQYDIFEVILSMDDYLLTNVSYPLGEEFNTLNLSTGINLNIDLSQVIGYKYMETSAYVFDAPDDFTEVVLAGIMVDPIDTDNPVISTPTVNVDVDNPISFSEIKSQITATDPTEGDITSKIEIVSNEYVLDANGKIPVGDYKYVVRVTDEALNSTTVTGLICVRDIKAPVVTANNATILYNVKLTDEEIRSLFNYSDNYDSTESLNVVINIDALTNTLGTYDIICTVTDLSGNTGEATAKVTVYDNIRPTLYTPKNLTLSTVSPINYDDVFAKCGAYDGYDGEIEFTLTDTDKMVETKAVGSYTWTIEASDSTGNTSSQTFEIIIVDKDIPVINFNTDYFFYTSKFNLLSETDIVSMLLCTNQVTGSIDSNNIESITSDYFNSPHEVGEYDLKVKLSDGTTYDNTVVVTEEPEKEFKFTDLFTKVYWETWANNWKTPDNWNWLHWTIISIGAVAVLAAVVAVLKKKR